MLCVEKSGSRFHAHVLSSDEKVEQNDVAFLTHDERVLMFRSSLIDGQLLGERSAFIRGRKKCRCSSKNGRLFGQVRDRLTPIPCVPTGSGDFPSNSTRKIIAKAAGRVFQIYEEPRKSEFTDLELPNTTNKKSWG